jgi:YVTN family beta-propeller protein
MLGVVTLAACAATPTPAAQPAVPGERQALTTPGSSPASWLYVCNQDDATVSVLDMETLQVLRTVDLQALGYSATARPHHVAVEPDGSYWYVSLIGEGKVVKLDTQDRVVGEAPFESPGMLSLLPGQDLLVVGRSMSAVNPPSRIGMIRPSDMSIDELDVFFPRPHAIALEPSTGIVYTASLGVNQIAAVDPVRERVELVNVEGPQHALMQFAISPDGSQMVISGELSHTAIFFDISDPMKPRRVGTVEVGSQPFDPIYTLDGRQVYLGNKAANTITLLDAERFVVEKVFDDPRIREPHGAVLSPDGRYVFISNTNVREDHSMMAMGGDHSAHAAHGAHTPAAPVRGGLGSVAVIDVATREIVEVVEMGNNTTGMGAPTRR